MGRPPPVLAHQLASAYQFLPVEEGATYRFQCRWRTTGSAAKVFIKCYDELPTSFRTREGGDSLKTEKREVYRSQQNLQGSAGAWNVQTEDFTPQHTQFTPPLGTGDALCLLAGRIGRVG